MRLNENLESVYSRGEFGTGLRVRLVRARTLTRDRTSGSPERIVVPESLELAGPALALVPDPADDCADEAFETLLELTRTVDGRENLDLQHSHAIAALARNLARALGLDEEAARRAYLAGMFHDLGKIELPEMLLRKPGPLNTREWEEMARHAERGAELVDRIGGLRDVAEIVASHHERWDGVGYPNRIAGEAIPIEARIVSASDAFVTMTADRPFRQALPVASALTELIRSAGSGYDPNVVGAVLELAVERRLGIGEQARPSSRSAEPRGRGPQTSRILPPGRSVFRSEPLRR
jgi:putative nucleotidyltransferase with HDIG domain